MNYRIEAPANGSLPESCAMDNQRTFATMEEAIKTLIKHPKKDCHCVIINIEKKKA